MNKLLLMIVAVVLVGCAGPGPGWTSFGSEKTWQSDVFSAHVLGKTTAEILEEFGKPDSVKGVTADEADIFYWVYRTYGRVIDTDSGNHFYTVSIYFERRTRKVVNTLFQD